MVTTVTMSGPGTTTILDDAAAAILAQNLLLGPTAVKTPGSIPALLSTIADNNKATFDELQKLNKNLERLGVAIAGISNALTVNGTGLANISHHMADANVTQKLAYVSQTNHNEFVEQTTNTALIDAGKPPTEVKEADMLDKLKQNAKDYTLQAGVTKSSAFVEETITDTISSAYKTSVEWVAQSSFGVWIKNAWVNTEVAVVGLFSKEEAQRIANKAKLEAQNISKNP